MPIVYTAYEKAALPACGRRGGVGVSALLSNSLLMCVVILFC